MTTAAERIDPTTTALIAYDVCKRILTPPDPAARERMRPHLESWAVLINSCREMGIPIIYTTPVSRANGDDVVMLPTDLSAETGTPPLTNTVEGSEDSEFPDSIAPKAGDYVFLKRRPSAFYGTGVAELLRMLRKNTIIIGGGGSNRGVETSVREAFNMDLMAVVVREVCYGGNKEAHEWAMNVAMKMFGRIRTLEQTLAMLRG
ncbi:MAG: cysteine hydrolase [Chloroflexi bacterium]|nr:cysteine hydrolase [Chloroflexota bacterium]